MTENKEIEQFRVEYESIVHDYFNESMDDVKKYLEQCEADINSLKECYEIYQKSNITDLVTVNDILLIYSTFLVSSYKNWRTFYHIKRVIEDLKGVSMLLFDIPLNLLEGALPEVMKQSNQGLERLKKELETLREEGVTVGLESSEKIEKGLELYVKQHEEAVKALRKMVV